jgi:hypothetical protein
VKTEKAYLSLARQARRAHKGRWDCLGRLCRGRTEKKANLACPAHKGQWARKGRWGRRVFQEFRGPTEKTESLEFQDFQGRLARKGRRARLAHKGR